MKIAVHKMNVFGSSYSHIGGGIDPLDLSRMFKILFYNLAIFGNSIENALEFDPVNKSIPSCPKRQFSKLVLWPELAGLW